MTHGSVAFSHSPALPFLDAMIPKADGSLREKEQRKETVQQIRLRFLTLIAPLKRHLYNYISKSMNFSEEANDVYQDTLLKAFRYFNSYDPSRSFKTWIFTIASNTIRDYYRASRQTLPLHEAQIGWSESFDSQRLSDIYDLVARLKPRQREVFFLYYHNQFKVREIHRITGLSSANIKFILFQARQTIKKSLLQDEEHHK